MQPAQTTPLPQDIKTLADWLYDEFRATDPMEVKNILDTPYHFKYCIGETIETPDQVSRKVMDRQYEEYTLQPGETKVMMGAAAYIFVDGVARTYLYHYVTKQAKIPTSEGGMGLDHAKAEEQGANATADVAQLVEAAKLAIVGRVGYATHSQPVTTPLRPVVPTQEPTAPAGHNPNAIADDNGQLPSQTPAGNEVPPAPTTAPELPNGTGDEDPDAFANLGNDNPPATEFTLGDDFYDTTANGRGRKNKQFISNEEFAAAQAQYAATPTA